MLDPIPRRFHRVLLPVSSSVASAFPQEGKGSAPTVSREHDFPRGQISGLQIFLMFRPPSLLVSQIVPTAAILPQGSRDFYFRAERASLPPHAPDMLTVRIQAIDGTRTFTLLDSQPCRLLPSGVGGSPVRSRVARRIRVERPAGATGFRLAASSLASTN